MDERVAPGNSRAGLRIWKLMHPPTARNRPGAGRRQGSSTKPALGGVGTAAASGMGIAILATALATALLAAPQQPANSQQSSSQTAQRANSQPTQQPANSQQPPPASGKIESKVKEVTLYATVRDKKGKIVPALNKDDFTLEQDGAPQTISYFARTSDAPL